MKSRLALVIALAACLVGAFQLLPSSPEEDPTVGRNPEQAAQPSGPEGDGVAELAADPEAGAELSRAEAVAATGGTGWTVSGSVEFEGQLPGDEQCVVLARAVDFEWNTTVALPPSAIFQLEVPDEVRALELQLDGRYLRSPEPVEVSRATSTEVVLGAQLGAWLQVRLGPPAGSPPAELDAAEVKLRDADAYLAKSVPARSLGEGLFEFRALEADQLRRLVVECPGFVSARRDSVRTFAGRSAVLEIEMLRGASVSGLVRGADGAPAAGHPVVLARFDGTRIANFRWIEERSLDTDEQGRFACAGLEPGRWRVSSSGPGLLPVTEELGELADGEVRSGLELGLAVGSALAGSVTWPGGEPAIGAEVRVFTEAEPWRSTPAVVDASGRFEVSGLTDAVFSVVAAATRDGDGGARWSMRQDDVPAGARGVQLVLELGGRVSGEVSDDLGQAAEDFTVRAFPLDAERAADARESMTERERDAGGAFVLEGLGDGPWDIQVEAAGYAPAPKQRVNMPEGPTELSFVLHRNAMVTGQVVDPGGAPIPAAQVRATSASAKGERAETDENGVFTIADLAPGEVEFIATADGLHSNAPQSVTLTAGEVLEELRLVLRVGARVEGEIDPSIEDFANRKVLMMPADSYETTSTLCDENGHFALEGLAPGRWTVMFDWQSSGGGGGDWVTGFSRRCEQELVLTEGETTHVVLGRPAPEAVTLSGTVTRAGEPCAEYLMYAFPHVNDTAKPSAMPLMITRTDAQGRYSMTLPAPGPHRFSVGPDTQYQVRYFHTVPADPEAVHDVEYPTATLSGRVMLPDGTPVGRHPLMLVHADADVDSRAFGDLHTTGTDVNGAFSYGALQPGEYILRTGGWGLSDSGLGVRVLGDISIEEGQEVADLVIELEPSGVVEGVVVDRAGLPQQGVRVNAIGNSGRQLYVWSVPTSDHAGFFRLPSVGAGAVRLVAEAPDGRRGEAQLTVTPGEAYSLTVQLDDE